MSQIKSFIADKLKVFVYTTRDEMGKAAAEAAGKCISDLLSQKDEVNIIFAAAPSQNETLFYLTQYEGINWGRINAFHMDEYIGLSPSAPQGFGNFLNEHIFSKLPFKSVNYIAGDAEDFNAECERYSALLEEYPVDVVCLGIGENGHIAFNDPWVAKFDDEALVKAVPLDEICRMQQVNDGCFKSIDAVPTHALTLTVPALARAAHLFCTVPAATKAWAVAATVKNEISEKVPATIMRRHPDASLFCDASSAAQL